MVTIINSLNQKLALQEKIRSEFLADLSHEIKTPITAIQCFIEGVQDKVIEMNEKNLDFLGSEIDRLTKITTELLEYNRLENDTETVLQKENRNVLPDLRFIMAQYTKQLQSNHQNVILQNENEWNVYASEDRLLQVFHNLFSNFLRYAGNGSTLTIRYKNNGKNTALVFADD